MQVINPFAVKLNSSRHAHRYNEVEELRGKCVYRNGDYTIWKIQPNFYNHCWKNIIFHQLTGANKDLINAMVAHTEKNNSSFIWQDARAPIAEGLNYAKKWNIQITNI